ncbi:hypothetical protein N7537_007128 [Penicillium hordei]|uniref:Uncharacterized protein n=1 Tax=Penicillium hordei TaxID=40994 RepID=A0AAD6E8S4_9EURO|nr:uncharacterized protein N7537_007128 [Penicillium hordei]KAJ5604172.1 hypothetical protein N7537_007128 [Penicillium hordei]
MGSYPICAFENSASAGYHQPSSRYKFRSQWTEYAGYQLSITNCAQMAIEFRGSYLLILTFSYLSSSLKIQKPVFKAWSKFTENTYLQHIGTSVSHGHFHPTVYLAPKWPVRDFAWWAVKRTPYPGIIEASKHALPFSIIWMGTMLVLGVVMNFGIVSMI